MLQVHHELQVPSPRGGTYSVALRIYAQGGDGQIRDERVLSRDALMHMLASDSVQHVIHAE